MKNRNKRDVGPSGDKQGTVGEAETCDQRPAAGSTLQAGGQSHRPTRSTGKRGLQDAQRAWPRPSVHDDPRSHPAHTRTAGRPAAGTDAPASVQEPRQGPTAQDRFYVKVTT